MNNKLALYSVGEARRQTTEALEQLKIRVFMDAKVSIDRAIANGKYHAEVCIDGKLLPQAYSDLTFELTSHGYRYSSTDIAGDRYVSIYWGPVEEPKKPRGFWNRVHSVLRKIFMKV